MFLKKNFDKQDFVQYIGNKENLMQKYRCDVCGWIYDPARGVLEIDIPPGVAFEDLPEDFVCPECGVGKDQFSKMA